MGKTDNLPMPEVDFTRVGRKWTKQFGALIQNAERDNRVLLSLKPEGSSIEAIEAYEAMYEKYLAKLNAIGVEQLLVVADIVIAVPQECLTSDAPSTDEINWTDPESYDWVRQEVMVEFLNGLQTGVLAKKER